jgi:hypothetical protein
MTQAPALLSGSTLSKLAAAGALGGKANEDTAVNELEEAHLRKREAEKAAAVEALSEVISGIEARRREPDRWERDCLAHAFRMMSSGLYGAARTEVTSAWTPPSGRSSPLLPSDPAIDGFNLAVLKDLLGRAEAEPVKPFAEPMVKFIDDGRK